MARRAGSRSATLPPGRGPAPVRRTPLQARPDEMVIRVQRSGTYEFRYNGDRIALELDAWTDTLVKLRLKPLRGVEIRHGCNRGVLPRRQWLVVER